MLRRNSPEITRRITLGLVLAGLGLALIILDLIGILSPVEQVTSTVLTPLERASYQLGLNLSRFGDFLGDNEKLRQENEKLRQDLRQALDAQGRVAALANRVDQLEKQLDFRKNPDNRKFAVVNADVVNRDATGENAGLIINKGTSDGLDRGMPVVDASGYLVGRIGRAGAKDSLVLLITDSKIGVNVYTQRYGPDNKRIPIAAVDGTSTGQYGLKSDDAIRIGRIKPGSDIKPDDWVFTDSKGGTFPPNVLVGKVGRIIGQDGQPEIEASLNPIADLDHLPQVLVITSWGSQ